MDTSSQINQNVIWPANQTGSDLGARGAAKHDSWPVGIGKILRDEAGGAT